nr:thioredoxin family protein [Desulfobacterales bacterium]
YRLVAVTRRRLVKGVCILVGLSVLAASVWGGWRFTDDGPIEWVYYTEERCQQALEEDRVVVMVFTAAWCLNCKALEHSVLRSRTVVELLDQEDVVAMKVDITANNPAGLARLKSTGYLTIPLIVVLSPDGREVMKRSFYTANDLVEAIASARLSQ